ncbi:MAG: GCN5 family acetyltransferase [Porticoccus sp.]|uniref:hypothetical protein n=2 Tax=Porticoccus hydrocarbonoclasticus TaxID=1073414 RepID=UPI000C4CA342|nr:hypothetical protein [Porticoccus hydrocarbonoclasticus]MBG56966.1 GCN5 family acetyltransferase [Porticoccus sp.]
MTMSKFPAVKDSTLVGTYPAVVGAGGGYVWDAVLEYRVWCHPDEGDDYYYAFSSFEEAALCSEGEAGAEAPLALILQEEYISEEEPGQYAHVREQRITEWPCEFLSRPRRTESTIPNFMAPNAPSNRLEIIRGQS